MKLAIAGARHFHLHHLLDYIRQTNAAELVGVFEQDQSIRNSLEKQYGMPGFASLEEMFAVAEPDVIACFDIHSQRVAICTRALRAGISVLCDKPPALSLQELEELQKAVEESPEAKFTALFSERYNPPVRTLKRIIDEGMIGDVVNFTAFRPHKLNKSQREAWFFQRQEHGGILVDLAIHDLDIFHWITGTSVLEVAAQAGNLSCPEYPEFEDHGQMIFRAEGGITGLVKVDWLAPAAFPTHGDCRFFVTGTKGTIEVKTEGDIGTTGGTVIVCTGEEPPRNVALDVPSQNLYDDFFSAIRNDSQPPISADAVFRATEVVLQARAAADTKSVISLATRKDERRVII